MQLCKSVKVTAFINSYLLMAYTSLNLSSTKNNATRLSNWFLGVRTMQFLKIKFLQREADFSCCEDFIFMSSEHTKPSWKYLNFICQLLMDNTVVIWALL